MCNLLQLFSGRYTLKKSGMKFGMPCTQRAVLGYCDVVWDKKTIDVEEGMAGSPNSVLNLMILPRLMLLYFGFSFTNRCSFCRQGLVVKELSADAFTDPAPYQGNRKVLKKTADYSALTIHRRFFFSSTTYSALFSGE